MSCRIFIGAATGDGDRAAAAASLLRRSGYITVSSWHDRDDRMPSDKHITDLATRREIRRRNRNDLLKADVFVLMFSPECRGALMELAWAEKDGAKLFVVGKAMDITLMGLCEDTKFVDTIEQVIAALAAV